MSGLRADQPGPAPGGVDPLADLEVRLGYRFASRVLLEEALIHSSAQRRTRHRQLSNERLEFLGDRVLGLAIAEELLRRHPRDPEGTISPRHAVLVSEPVLAEVAREIGLGQALVVARSEAEHGRERPSILADALEAVIAAVYLDSDFETAAALVRRLFAGCLATVEAPPKVPKSTLQEWAQARGLARPVYQVLATDGPDHAPSFHVQAELVGFAPVAARAGSKRAAEQAAAALLLERLEQASLDAG